MKMTLLFKAFLILAFPFILSGNIIYPHSITPDRKDLYKKYCLTCHQADGSGVSGMFPPLIKTPKVLGPADSLIMIIISGLKGPTEVAGVTYTQNMPAVKNITDQEIAEVLNFVRHNWGNKAASISAAEVARIRSKAEKKP
jgi:mono/diheme cytochrome c family protein